MTDDNDSKGPRAPLTLKPRPAGQVASGVVKQSFSHGRSKTVVVETKRRRIDAPAAQTPADRRHAFEVRPAAPRPAGSPPPAAPPPRAQPTGGLSEEERRARQRVIEQAREQQAAEQARREAAAAAKAEADRRAAEAARQEAERRAAEARAAAAAAAPPSAPEAPAKVEAAPVAPPPPAAPAPAPTPRPPAPPAAEAAPPPRRPNPPPQRSEPPQRQERLLTSGVALNQRARPGGTNLGGRSAREAANRGEPEQRPQRTPRPGETVRYSANAPRTLRNDGASRGPGGPRPPGAGGPRPGASPPPGPDVARPNRHGAPRAGATTDRRPDFDDEEAARRGKAPAGRAVSRTKGEPKRREGRLTIQAVAGDDEGAMERMRSLASVRRAREREREKRKGGAQDTGRIMREVVIPDVITVSELAGRMATRAVEVIKFLVRQGMMLKPTDVIDSDTAELVASEFGHTVKRVSESDVETGFISEEVEHDDHLLPRPPVVAVMGHVDHGKTSLLDALRAADVAGGEHGGITQHIGAYQTHVASGQAVTFLDTPGHAAFSAMRARGAHVTDIVVLVVAADDGVMPQTIEAIQHAKAADAPIIVAVNKCDKPDANPQRVINELLQHEVVAESLGGETQVIEVSALKKTGLDDLLEGILVQAEVMDLKANPDRTAEGVVIEAKIDRGRGPVATVLVKRGTLNRGDIVVAGEHFGRVRALLNERGEQLKEATPAMPVEILGMSGAPSPGEVFAVVETEARARELTEYRVRQKRERNLTPVGAGAATLADMMAKLADKKVSELPLMVKADVQGSAEAIVASVEKLSTDEVRARVILSGAGGITESDVTLAKSAGASILGFNVRASTQARQLAEREGVEIRYYSIIYDLLDDIKGVLSGMLAPIQREAYLGQAEVLQVFDISKVGRVAGCRLRDGVVRRGARVRIVRKDVVVLELGVLETLKRFKDEVAEVSGGQECGMAFRGFQDIQVGDMIECFLLEEVKRSL